MLIIIAEKKSESYENKEKQTYIIKSNNPKFPVGLLRK